MRPGSENWKEPEKIKIEREKGKQMKAGTENRNESVKIRIAR